MQYQKLYEGGICEIEPGLYSTCIQFADINYQIARREDQIDIFTRWCNFLNYFDTSIGIQLTIRNKFIQKQDLQNTLLLKDAGDGLNPFRKEYNNMILEKAVQGQNSIIREKNIVVSYRADNLQQAIATSGRIEVDVGSNLKRLGCENVALNGQARVNQLYSYTHPTQKTGWNYRYLLDSNLTTKDYICPDKFDFTPSKHFTMSASGEETYGQVLFIKNLPPDLSDTLLSDISDIPCDLTISIHIEPVAHDKAFSLVKNQIAKMDLQRTNLQEKNAKTGMPVETMPFELQYAMDEAKELLDDLQNKNQRMFKLTALFYTSAKDLETMQDNAYQIISIARKHNCEIGILEEQQENGFNSILPIGKNHIPIKRTLTSASTGIFIPFTTQELMQPTGIYYGTNALSHNLLMFDRKSLKAPNGFILGTPGSGKSFKVKEEIVSILLRFPDDEVIIIDPEREYTRLADGFDGEVVHISAGSQAHINPMDINMDYSDNDNPLLLKTEFILTLCELLIGGKQGLPREQRSVIDRACTITYDKYFQNPKKNPMPTLKDFYNTLVAQPEPEAKSAALALELYIKGSLSVFANPTNVDIQKRLVVYDIRDLGKQLQTMGLLIVLDQIWNRITQNRSKGKRTWIYIDEIYLLFQNEYSAQYLYELWKRARKWGAIPTGITQNVEDLLRSDMARTMLSNTEFIVMLNQAASDRMQLAKILNISDEQLGYVTTAESGQGLLFAGNAIIPFVDKFPTDTQLYRMMTTKIEELEGAEIENGEK